MEFKVNSIHGFIRQIKAVASQWDARTTPWFRGEPNVVDTPLLPRVFRTDQPGRKLDENWIVQSFRRMAPAYVETPDTRETDQWLFLMQHLRVPTRLLDWTEGALIALYFALEFTDPVVWMLNPDELNQLSLPNEKVVPGVYPITWTGDNNIGYLNIRGAWEQDRVGTQLPVAIKPTYVHVRMGAQKSCFTIYGRAQEPMPTLVPESVLAKFVIRRKAVLPLKRDLKVLGITHTTVFPEADYLAREITDNAMSNAFWESRPGEV